MKALKASLEFLTPSLNLLLPFSFVAGCIIMSLECPECRSQSFNSKQ